MFTKENTARLIKLPFDIASARTGCGYLELDQAEEGELAASAAVAANEWLTISPAYCSLVLFGVSLAGIVGHKIAVFKVWAEIERRKLAIREAEIRGLRAEPPAAAAPLAARVEVPAPSAPVSGGVIPAVAAPTSVDVTAKPGPVPATVPAAFIAEVPAK